MLSVMDWTSVGLEKFTFFKKDFYYVYYLTEVYILKEEKKLFLNSWIWF